MRPLDPRLLRLLPQARRPVLALAAAGVGQGAAAVATAFALAALVVAVVRGADPREPASWVAVTFLVRAALGWTVERQAARTGVAVSAALRRRLLTAWLCRPEQARRDPAAATTLAAQGCTSIEVYVARFLPALVQAAVVPAFAVLALAVVDWPSALVVVLTVPLLPLFAALVGRTTQDVTRRRWGALAALSGHFLDVVRGLPTLAGYGRGERQVGVIRAVSERHRRATMAALRLAFLSSAALELLATISVALVAVTVGLRLAAGGLDLQTALVAILLAPEAYWPIRRVGAEFHAAADGAQALVSVLDELEPTPCSGPAAPTRPARTRPAPTRPARTRPARTRPAPTRPAPVAGGVAGDGRPGGGPAGVCLTGVTYTYPGSTTPVLRDVTLLATRGLTVVTGPSGAGKSTLLEVVAGLRPADRGEVEAGPAHLVEQRPFLLSGTVRENLTLGNDADPADLWAALRLVGLEGVVAALPQGLDGRIGDDGFGLSAGQKARLALARATLSRATVVLLDEPTAHLDERAGRAFLGVVRELARSRTVIAVTHRPELVAIADQHVALPRYRAAGAAPEQVSEACPSTEAGTR